MTDNRERVKVIRLYVRAEVTPIFFNFRFSRSLEQPLYTRDYRYGAGRVGAPLRHKILLGRLHILLRVTVFLPHSLWNYAFTT